MAEDFVEMRLKTHVEQPVSFVEDEHAELLGSR
jgi:hypothetical protein